jgi:hypothetical protein
MVMGYERSGLTRQQYCARQGIAASTLDYYRRRTAAQPALAHVKLTGAEPNPQPLAKTFALILVRGRRIETSWPCDEQQLTQLIRIVEAA